MQTSIVWRQPGAFAGWPANYGIWNWGKEILVGFGVGRMDITRHAFHAIAKTGDLTHWLARSRDGGHTWRTENPAERGPWIPPVS